MQVTIRTHHRPIFRPHQHAPSKLPLPQPPPKSSTTKPPSSDDKVSTATTITPISSLQGAARCATTSLAPMVTAADHRMAAFLSRKLRHGPLNALQTAAADRLCSTACSSSSSPLTAAATPHDRCSDSHFHYFASEAGPDRSPVDRSHRSASERGPWAAAITSHDAAPVACAAQRSNKRQRDALAPTPHKRAATSSKAQQPTDQHHHHQLEVRRTVNNVRYVITLCPHSAN